MQELLRFPAQQSGGTFESDELLLQVNVLGDDIRSIKIVSLLQNTTVFAERSSELLAAKMTSPQFPDVSSIATTRRGLAQTTIKSMGANARASVISLERRGVSRMEINLQEGSVLNHILCESVR